MESNPQKTPMMYATIYGPYAFGVASLLIIWFSIVKPELNSRAINFQAQIEVLQTLSERDKVQQDIADSMEKTSQTLTLTAQILERAVNRMEGEISREERN